MSEGMRMRPGHFLIAIAATSPVTAYAADRAPIADEHRLSEAEVQKILDAAAAKRDAPTLPAQKLPQAKDPARPIHGEMGVAIGTGGYREAFGTAVVPLGQDGVAIVSFDTVESNRGKRRRR